MILYKMQEKSQRFNWKQTINLNIWMLKIVGLWPKGDESYGINLYTLYAAVSIAIFQFGHVFFQTVNLYFIMDDLKAVTGTIFILLTEIGASLKTYCLIKNMKMLKLLMVNLNSDIFQPKNAHQRSLVQPNLKAWKMVVSLFWFFACGCMFFLSFFPILDKTYKEHRLPFLAWYPYSTTTSPLYEFTYLYQAVAINFINMANVNIDTLIAALNMYVGAQFDILSDNLRNLHEVGKDTAEEVNKKLIDCVRHHKEILKFADYANRFYNWLLFAQFFVGGISIGLAMFQLTIVVPFSSEFHSIMSYANAVSTEVFMYCWFGNEIQIKSSKLTYAVFEFEWTSLPQEVKKNLIIFLLRLQKSLQISALNLFYLSLDTFMRILRTAWSYFALLRQVNAPK